VSAPRSQPCCRSKHPRPQWSSTSNSTGFEPGRLWARRPSNVAQSRTSRASRRITRLLALGHARIEGRKWATRRSQKAPAGMKACFHRAQADKMQISAERVGFAMRVVLPRDDTQFGDSVRWKAPEIVVESSSRGAFKG
jgi:hypothetical protein